MDNGAPSPICSLHVIEELSARHAGGDSEAGASQSEPVTKLSAILRIPSPAEEQRFGSNHQVDKPVIWSVTLTPITESAQSPFEEVLRLERFPAKSVPECTQFHALAGI